MSDVSGDIGRRIRNFREAKNLTQQELELIIGSAFGHLSRIESGKLNPTKETLLKISQALKLDSRQQSLLLGTADQPATKEEFLSVFPYIKDYLEQCKNAVGTSDICGFMWMANESMLKLMGVPEKEWLSFLVQCQGLHVLEWLFNPAIPAYNRMPETVRKTILLNQTIFFLYLISYFERSGEIWIKELLERLKKFPDFEPIWDNALEKVRANVPLRREQALITFTTDDGSEIEFFINNTHVNKFPRFLLSEFVPAKIRE